MSSATQHSINSESESAFDREHDATRSLLHTGSSPLAERAALSSASTANSSALYGALVALLASLVVLLSVLAHGWLAWQWTHIAVQPAATAAAAQACEVFGGGGAAASAVEYGSGVAALAGRWAEGRVAPSTAGRYLFFIPSAGYSNQLHGFIKAMTVANAFNRTLVLPPLLSTHIVNQHSWFDKHGEDGRLLKIHVKQTKLAYYEQLSRYTSINATVLNTRDFVLASDFVRWHGANFDCWAWPSKHQYYGVGNYTDTNETSLCIGITHGMPAIDYTEQPQLPRFKARVQDWLVLDEEIVRDSRAWLQYANVDAANYSCLHYRGGDFKKFAGANYVSISGLVQRVNSTLGVHRNTVIITNTEDVDDRELLQRLPWRELTLNNVYAADQTEKLRDMKKLHMDMHMCTRAVNFMGCERSSMSRVLRTMRDCEAHTPACLDYCDFTYKP